MGGRRQIETCKNFLATRSMDLCSYRPALKEPLQVLLIMGEKDAFSCLPAATSNPISRILGRFLKCSPETCRDAFGTQMVDSKQFNVDEISSSFSGYPDKVRTKVICRSS